MRIIIVTPANLGKHTGNSITAIRWADILNRLGYKTSIVNEYRGDSFDVMIALNAFRSRVSIMRFKEVQPHKQLMR